MEPHFWLGIFTAANTLLITLLAMNVSRLRIRERIANGDGGNIALKKAIRAHGNGVEHLVVVSLQVLVLAWGKTPSSVVATLVIVFTASRLLHAIGMLGSRFRFRQLGALGTYASELAGVAAVFHTCVYA